MRTSSPPRIGLVMKSLAAEFFQNMRAAAEAYARQRGDLDLVSVGTESQTEVQRQVELVDDLTRRHVDALVIIPIDSEALVPPVVAAVKTGIKVVNSDVLLNQQRLALAGINVPFVGPDNVLAAKVVGDVLARHVGPGGKVVLIEGIAGALNAQQRREGFLRSITDNDLLLLKSRDAYWETDIAAEVFRDLLREHPDIDGVMCSNDAMALGVMRVLDEIEGGNGITAVGIDNDPSIRPYVNDGRLLATVDLQGPQMVVKAINFAVEALSGKERRGWLRTPVRIITRESLVEPLI